MYQEMCLAGRTRGVNAWSRCENRLFASWGVAKFWPWCGVVKSMIGLDACAVTFFCSKYLQMSLTGSALHWLRLWQDVARCLPSPGCVTTSRLLLAGALLGAECLHRDSNRRRRWWNHSGCSMSRDLLPPAGRWEGGRSLTTSGRGEPMS